MWSGTEGRVDAQLVPSNRTRRSHAKRSDARRLEKRVIVNGRHTDSWGHRLLISVIRRECGRRAALLTINRREWITSASGLAVMPFGTPGQSDQRLFGEPTVGIGTRSGTAALKALKVEPGQGETVPAVSKQMSSHGSFVIQLGDAPFVRQGVQVRGDQPGAMPGSALRTHTPR